MPNAGRRVRVVVPGTEEGHEEGLGRPCPCGAETYRLCEECEGERDRQPCWCCAPVEMTDGSGVVFGLIEVDRAEAEGLAEDGYRILVLHHRLRRR